MTYDGSHVNLFLGGFPFLQFAPHPKPVPCTAIAWSAESVYDLNF